jgi:hypothetical protein
MCRGSLRSLEDSVNGAEEADQSTEDTDRTGAGEADRRQIERVRKRQIKRVRRRGGGGAGGRAGRIGGPPVRPSSRLFDSTDSVNPGLSDVGGKCQSMYSSPSSSHDRSNSDGFRLKGVDGWSATFKFVPVDRSSSNGSFRFCNVAVQSSATSDTPSLCRTAAGAPSAKLTTERMRI